MRAIGIVQPCCDGHSREGGNDDLKNNLRKVIAPKGT
jgi:hypothetical protein